MISFADLHADTICACFNQQQNLNCDKLMICRKSMDEFSSYLQVFAHFIAENIQDKYEYFTKMHQYGLSVLSSAGVQVCDSFAAADLARAEGKPIAFLSVENGDFFSNRQDIPDKARGIREKGIRFFSLVYNNGNSLGGGAMQPKEYTLSSLGKNVVEALEGEGITIDVSHANDATTRAILEVVHRPVVATHSNALALCPHPRNISDANLRKIAESGGLIGLNLYPPFLRKGEKATVEDIARQMRYMIDVAGEDAVVMGADFDGVDLLPREVLGLCSIPALYERLQKYGLSDIILDKVFYQNAYRFIKNNF